MEQVEILFFVLASFFGIENPKIAADKTTVTINPQTQMIQIVQNRLFVIAASENDKEQSLAEFKKLLNRKESGVNWSDDLGNFTDKVMNTNIVDDKIEISLKMKYTTEANLKVLGIWYNTNKNLFSINHVPDFNLSTDSGVLEGNYWNFSGEDAFSFTLEPYLQLPEQYQKSKTRLIDILIEK